ncbi:ML5 [Symbiodinium natans]|uniref:ML5 protein n=1 Tax=Symbiodinium natans TaxID=878477 RepID=A0A812NQE9_9DINO|nr:ML5 [Symbiodinium natans]
MAKFDSLHVFTTGGLRLNLFPVVRVTSQENAVSLCTGTGVGLEVESICAGEDNLKQYGKQGVAPPWVSALVLPREVSRQKVASCPDCAVLDSKDVQNMSDLLRARLRQKPFDLLSCSEEGIVSFRTSFVPRFALEAGGAHDGQLPRVFGDLLGVQVSMSCCLHEGADLDDEARGKCAMYLIAYVQPEYWEERGKKPGIFKVTLTYDGRKIGADFDGTDAERGLMVKTLAEDGMLPEWNLAYPDMEVKPFDMVIAVNEEAGAVKDFQSKTAAPGESFTLTMQRPDQYEISMSRTKSLGIKLSYKKSSQGIVIGEILPDGAFEQWNYDNPALQVTAGDRIVAVGGDKLLAEDMTKRPLSCAENAEAATNNNVTKPLQCSGWDNPAGSNSLYYHSARQEDMTGERKEDSYAERWQNSKKACLAVSRTPVDATAFVVAVVDDAHSLIKAVQTAKTHVVFPVFPFGRSQIKGSEGRGVKGEALEHPTFCAGGAWTSTRLWLGLVRPLPGEAEAPPTEVRSEKALVEASRCFEAAKAKLEVAIAKVLADAGREGREGRQVERQVAPLGWVEQALQDVVQESDPHKRRRGLAAGWVAETFAKLVGSTPGTPRGTCRVNALLQAPPTAWEHPQGKAGGWVDEAFAALTDDCCHLKELPSRSLCEGRVGTALQRLKSLGGWAWVAFA